MQSWFMKIKLPINIRLKGDWVNDHLVGDKWSFRLN